jgi:NitT/TauT family transport system substrate-binding protein
MPRLGPLATQRLAGNGRRPDALFRKLIDSKPAVLKAYVEGAIAGWHDYLYGDSKAANELIKKDNPDETNDIIAYGIAKMKEYGIVDGGNAAKGGIGIMTDAKWKEFFDIMLAQKVYPASLGDKQAFTLDFLPTK